jgi:hypothetical protein
VLEKKKKKTTTTRGTDKSKLPNYQMQHFDLMLLKESPGEEFALERKFSTVAQ